MRLKETEIAWLRRWNLVDENVDLEGVQVHIGGPAGYYLKITNHGAITTGGHIWFKTLTRRDNIALVVHELVHVGQYRRLGKTRFLLNYLAGSAKRGGYSREHPLEAPAYARQELARAIIAQHGGPAV
jgi:hypothetical protein